MEKTMQELMKELTAPIPPEEIELRVGTVSHPKGFSLLAYKNSRIDVRRLNEVFGSRWKVEYDYDSKGDLVCIVSVYDVELGEWISREDIGNPSQGTGNESKGAHSDALKRACFRWGIGTELYDMPFLWVNQTENDFKTGKNGKHYPKCQYKIRDWKLSYSDGVYIVKDENGRVMCQAKAGAVDYPKDEPEPKSEPAIKTEKTEPTVDIKTIGQLTKQFKAFTDANCDTPIDTEKFIVQCYNASMKNKVNAIKDMFAVDAIKLASGLSKAMSDDKTFDYFIKQIETYIDNEPENENL